MCRGRAGSDRTMVGSPLSFPLERRLNSAALRDGEPFLCVAVTGKSELLDLFLLLTHFPFTEHAAVLLHRAFLVGMYGQIDTSSQISEALKVLHMEAMI